MEQKELDQKVTLHKTYIESDGKEGEKLNLIGTDLRCANLIDADLRGAILRDADLRYADLRRADLIGANLIDANLSGANLSDAYLTAANLSDAILIDAILKGTYLRCTHLSSAILSGANMSGADLSFTEVYGFYLDKDFAFYHQGSQYKDGDYLKIGCYGYSLEYWLDNYQKIGEKRNYTPAEIRLYGNMIKFIRDNIKKPSLLVSLYNKFQEDKNGRKTNKI